MELNTGKELQNGKYRILGILGQGGFGITYLAEQTSLGRKVAIKEFFMKDLCNRDDDGSHVSVGSVGSKELVERFRQKFLKEARSIASLEHKHIVPIIDVFEENGTAYYVMKYFGGGSLSACTALSEEKALRYIRQIASAIGFIHSRHMMHLDIKPGNILLDSEDNAIVIDFGLAKQYDEAGHQTSTTPVGISHGYAPLEQYKAGGVSSFSPATDIYSLGATLYRLLTDNRPADAMDLVSAPFPACPANVSASTWNAVKSAMQPAISSRPQSVKEFIALLENQDVIVGSEETEVASDATNLSMGTGQNTANGNAAVEEQEDIAVEVVETPSVAPELAPRPQPEENQKKNKWFWIIILLACCVAGCFMLLGGGEKNGPNSFNYVDLGLPSGLKWANRNVGASSPDGYGDYLDWDEAQECGLRIPTKEEFEELEEYCEWTWTTQNGVEGYKVTSKKNGNSIFLPAAGWRVGTSLGNQGTNGYYWSSSPHESYSDFAYNLDVSSGFHGTGWDYRYDGHSVRPVSE